MIARYVQQIQSLASMAFVGVGRVVNNAAHILVVYSIVLLTQIEPYQTGQITQILSLIAITTLFSDLGMVEGVQKFMHRHSPVNIITSALAIKGIAVVVVLLGLLVVHQFTGMFPYGFGLTAGLFVAVCFASAYNILVLVHNGLGQRMRSAVYQAVNMILLFGFLFLSYGLFDQAVDAVLFSISISWTITSVAVLLDLLYTKKLAGKIGVNQQFLWFSLNNSVYIMAALLLLQTDILFISHFLGFETGGLYKSVALMAIIPKVVGLFFITPLFPVWVDYFEKKAASLLRRWLYISAVSIGLLLTGISVFFFVYTEFVFGILYPGQQVLIQTAVEIFPLLIVAFSIHTLSFFAVSFLEAIDEEKYVRIVYICAIAVYCIGMFTFISSGVEYAIYVLAATEAFACIALTTRIIQRMRDVSFCDQG